MYDALRAAIQPLLDESETKGWNNGWNDGRNNGRAEAYDSFAQKMIARGMDGFLISDMTGYDRRRIDTIARRLNRHVQWNESNP